MSVESVELDVPMEGARDGGNALVGALRSVKIWFHWSYVVDWALCGLLFALVQTIPRFLVEPYHRHLPVDDPAFEYPNLDSIVPVWLLFLSVTLLPVMVFALAQIGRWRVDELHHCLLSTAQGLTLNSIATNLIKYAAGRYRPNWYDRQGTGALMVKDARMSFPSGHSSLTFCAATVISLYFLGRSRVLSPRVNGHFWVLLLCLLPYVYSAFVAVSRTRDYHHHFSDILAGSIIGTATGVAAFLLNFESVIGERSGLVKHRVALVDQFGLGDHGRPRSPMQELEEMDGEKIEM